MRPWKQWTEIGLATISFGQGIATSTVQLAAAYRVLAAKGIYKQPKLVLSIEKPDGQRLVTSSGKERRVFSEDTVERVVAMMEKVVAPGGTGLKARVPGYRVAGKTGTAQKVDPITKAYSADLYQAIFGGFLPAQDPQVVIVVTVDEPEGVHTGGAVAAPVFAEIGEAAMRQLRVLPSPAVVAQKKLDGRSDGGVEEEQARPAVLARDFSVTPMKENGRLPSFVGLTARQSVERFVALGWDVEFEMVGSGTVVRQNPKSGLKSEAVEYVRLTLAQD